MPNLIFQVDAFTDQLFGGNPAAVCPLTEWLPETLMQHIAAENNLSETAFFVQNGGVIEIRWFTPKGEVPLCGHATLATAHVIFNSLGWPTNEIAFHSASGPLSVSREGEWYTLDFPEDMPQAVDELSGLNEAMGHPAEVILKGQNDYFAVYASQEVVQNLRPNAEALLQLPLRGVIATAPGETLDFVSRFFVPALGIPEDPVTGSAHTLLFPYWGVQLNKTEMTARQISARGGYLKGRINGERVLISGQAQLFMEGHLHLDRI